MNKITLVLGFILSILLAGTIGVATGSMLLDFLVGFCLGGLNMALHVNAGTFD